MLDRRQFHAGLIASLAGALLPRLAHAAAPPSPDLLWLNRLTFGASTASRAELARLGPQAWLEDQLSRPAADPDLDARLADARLHIAYDAGQDENGHSWPAANDLRPLRNLTADPADLAALVDWSQGMDYSERSRPASEVLAASLIRAVHSPAQLREVMTQFWHDHFNVNSQKNEYTAAFFPLFDAALRQNALGNFRVLLGAVARSPSMLYYLNNDESRASPANENFARELLELHTLGAARYFNDRVQRWQDVPGAAEGLASAYLDLDVYEVARAFTGWTVADGRWIAEGLEAPRSGQFYYAEAWHDPYQKRVLAVEFPPNRAPMADGEQVLDILARHPGTAAFICEKIARRLLTDDPPPGLVDRLAQVFLAANKAPDQIAQVVRALVLSPEFATLPPTKLRRPFEVLAALYRRTGAEVTGTENAFQWTLMQAGWRQHEYGPPTGHPDRIESWTGATALNRVVDLVLYAHEDWFQTATLDLTTLQPGETVAQFFARWAAPFDQGADAALSAYGWTPDQAMSDFSREDRIAAASAVIAFAALTPDFLLR